jgi:predicted RNA binding protein YcfA (HicA-like mRNA interferase family)
VLLRVGFVVNRQRGSHIILRRGNPYARVVVPDHKRVRSGTLRQILNQAGVTVEQLLELR